MSERGLLQWFRLNLALMTAALSLFGAAGLFLINTTREVTVIESQLDKHERALRDMAVTVSAIQTAEQDQNMRLGLIEERLRWALERVPASPLPASSSASSGRGR